MKKLLLFLSLTLVSQVSFSYSGGDARKAQRGEVIQHYEDPVFVTQWIYSFCQLETVIIIPSNTSNRVGAVCKKR